MKRAYKLYGTILGAIIMVAASILVIYSLMEPNFMDGRSLYVGISGIAIGAIIVFAAWKS